MVAVGLLWLCCGVRCFFSCVLDVDICAVTYEDEVCNGTEQMLLFAAA